MGWKIALVSLFVLVFYTVMIRKFASMWFRINTLKDANGFDALYWTRKANIRINGTSEILAPPVNWMDRIQEILKR